MRLNNRLLIAPLICFFALCVAYFPESIDDAFITLRYSRNLLHGNGPVFNIGEHVEGYSNFLWMALLAVSGKAGLQMPVMMKVYGVVAGAIVTVLITHLARKQFGQTSAVATAFVIGTSSFFALWAVDGLETVFYSALVTALFALSISRNSSDWLIGLAAGAVGITRPEGVLFGCVALYFILNDRGFKFAIRAAMPFTLLVGGYEIFRYEYFGELVSNTALAKVHTDTSTVIRGLQYLFQFNSDSGYLILPAALAGAFINRRNRAVWLAVAFISAQALFLGVSGGDFMYGYRFVMPVFPLLAFVACSSVAILDPRNLIKRVIILSVLVASIATFQLAAIPPKSIGIDNLWTRRSVHFEIAEYLRERTTSADNVALSEAGIIPFALDATVYDYLGLNSPYRKVFTNEGRLDVSNALAGDPKFVIVSIAQDHTGVNRTRMAVEASILEAPVFKARYQAVQRFEIPRSTSYLNQIYYKYTPDAKVIYFEVYQRTNSLP